MHKTYTVSAFAAGGQQQLRADSIPHPVAQTGPKYTLDMTSNQNVYVQGAGHDATIDLTVRDFIYTTGLYQCFALCAVWNKVNDIFQNGYLAHVSSPGPPRPRVDGPPPYFHTALANIPPGAWIIVDTAHPEWAARIVAKMQEVGHHDDHIWIYLRTDKTNVGFGIDKYGRFGET